MGLNDFWDSPFETITEPYTDIFESVTGNGSVFFLFPVIVLTIALYIKTQSGVMASMFMIGCGALLSAINVFGGNGQMTAVFIIFTAFGFVGLFVSMLFQK